MKVNKIYICIINKLEIGLKKYIIVGFNLIILIIFSCKISIVLRNLVICIQSDEIKIETIFNPWDV